MAVRATMAVVSLKSAVGVDQDGPTSREVFGEAHATARTTCRPCRVVVAWNPDENLCRTDILKPCFSRRSEWCETGAHDGVAAVQTWGPRRDPFRRRRPGDRNMGTAWSLDSSWKSWAANGCRETRRWHFHAFKKTRRRPLLVAVEREAVDGASFS